jgi:hypothetical protein
MQPLAAVTRLAAAAIPGAVLGLVVAVLTDPLLGVLAAINGAAALFVVTAWIVLWPLDADHTRDTVQREDFRPVATELVIVAAVLTGLVGIVVLLLLSGSGSGPAAAAIAAGGVFMVWAKLHLMYNTRYAHLYVGGRRRRDRLQFRRPARVPRLPVLVRAAARVRAENRDTAFDQRFSRILLSTAPMDPFWRCSCGPTPPRDPAGVVLDHHQEVEAAPKRRFGRYDETAFGRLASGFHRG